MTRRTYRGSRKGHAFLHTYFGVQVREPRYLPIYCRQIGQSPSTPPLKLDPIKCVSLRSVSLFPASISLLPFPSFLPFWSYQVSRGCDCLRLLRAAGFTVIVSVYIFLCLVRYRRIKGLRGIVLQMHLHPYRAVPKPVSFFLTPWRASLLMPHCPRFSSERRPLRKKKETRALRHLPEFGSEKKTRQRYVVSVDNDGCTMISYSSGGDVGRNI